jgi:hypothetical protein
MDSLVGASYMILQIRKLGEFTTSTSWHTVSNLDWTISMSSVGAEEVPSLGTCMETNSLIGIVMRGMLGICFKECGTDLMSSWTLVELWLILVWLWGRWWWAVFYRSLDSVRRAISGGELGRVSGRGAEVWPSGIGAPAKLEGAVVAWGTVAAVVSVVEGEGAVEVVGRG